MGCVKRLYQRISRICQPNPQSSRRRRSPSPPTCHVARCHWLLCLSGSSNACLPRGLLAPNLPSVRNGYFCPQWIFPSATDISDEIRSPISHPHRGRDRRCGRRRTLRILFYVLIPCLVLPPRLERRCETSSLIHFVSTACFAATRHGPQALWRHSHERILCKGESRP